MREMDVEAWLRYARDDLESARVSLEGTLFSRACFACQQVAEKALKAYLIKTTGNYPRIHSLVDLLNLAQATDSSLDELKSHCETLDEYYLPIRYPSARPAEDVGRQEAETAIELARGLLAAVQDRTAKS